jgi:flagellar hook-associated protein 1 FlgK
MLMSNLYTGNTGLVTSQNALNTTAHNLSNINTEGYTRQQVSQGDCAYQTLSKNYKIVAWKQIGRGVTYNNCKQVRSFFLDQQYRLEAGRNSFYDVSVKTLEEVEDQLQELNGTEFADSLNNLWVSVQEMAKDPTNATNQNTFVTRANEFLTRAQSVYQGLIDYQENMDQQVVELVNQINAYGDRIRELNEDIVEIESGDQEHANDLRDERNLLLDKLGELGNIDYYEDIWGNVLVSFEGTQFVTTDHVNHMGVDTTLVSSVGFATPYWEFAAKHGYDELGNRVVLDISGAKVFDLTLPVSTQMNTDVGKLRATMLARGDHYATYHDITDDSTGSYYSKNISQSVIMNVEAEFDQLVNNIITTINSVLEQAPSNPANYTNKEDDSVLPSFYDLFVMSAPEDTLKYDIDDDHKAGENPTGFTIRNTMINDYYLQTPTLLEYRLEDGSEDTETMNNLKAAFTNSIYTLNPNTATTTDFLGYYNMLVSQVATSGSVYNSISESQQQTVDTIANAREEIHGVSSDEELQFMIQFQNAFNASSRYINVVSEMLEHLVTSLGHS